MNYDNNIFKLIDRCNPNSDNNTIVSGLSIKIALTMLLNGAEGESKNQLTSFLSKDIAELNEDSKKMLAECGEHLKLANSFWFGDKYHAKEEFKQLIKLYQDAEIFTEDFNAPQTLEKLNNWVSEKTENLIPQVLDKLDNTTTSLLINTLYFKDQWSNPISEYSTKDALFHGLDMENTVKMMEPTSKLYYENSKVKGFGLTYADSPYVFIGILPNEEGPINLESLDLNNLKLENGKYDVRAKFPRLDLEFETKLKSILQEMGLVAPFSNGFDFNKILDIPQTVDEIIHKTKFKLDEKGTEAAAATVVMMTRGMASIPVQLPIINLEFNRPFVFMIKHTLSNETLFVGKINNL